MHTISQQEVESLTAELFAAVVEPRHWVVPLQRLARLLGARGIRLDAVGKDVTCHICIASVLDGKSSADSTFASATPDCFIETFGTGTVERIPASSAHGTTASEATRHAACTTPARTCVLRVPVLRSDSWQTYLTLDFATLCADQEAASRTFLQAIVPWLARALEIHFKLHSVELQRALHVACLDRWSSGIVVTDERLRILLTNRVDDDLMVDGRTIRCLNGHLRFVHAGDCRRFTALRARLREKPEESASMLLGTETGGRSRYSLHVHHGVVDPEKHSSTTLFISMTRLEKSNATRYIQRLRDLFGLSCAEAQLAVAMLRGLALKVAAQQRGISYESARFTLRQIYAKVGVNKQATLVALLAQAVTGFD
jgi:DNA-binding CsgD family transcriptional regulator